MSCLELWLNQTIVPVPPLIYYVDFIGGSIGKHEEIVAQKLHLQNSFFDGHGFHSKSLGLNYPRRGDFLFLSGVMSPREPLLASSLGPVLVDASGTYLVLGDLAFNPIGWLRLKAYISGVLLRL